MVRLLVARKSRRPNDCNSILIMAKTIKINATDGAHIEFVDEMIGSGGMKDVYFSPDKSYVVAFFRDKQDFNAKDRLQNITCLLYTSPSPRDGLLSRMPSSA